MLERTTLQDYYGTSPRAIRIWDGHCDTSTDSTTDYSAGMHGGGRVLNRTLACELAGLWHEGWMRYAVAIGNAVSTEQYMRAWETTSSGRRETP